MNCPTCGKPMELGFLYVRGIGAALFWAKEKDIGTLSRRGLEQIDLSELSVRGTGTQAVLGAARCSDCSAIAFDSVRRPL